MIDLEPIISIVGRTVARSGGNETKGTAFLIGNDRLLTCAHCLRVDGMRVDQLEIQMPRFGTRTARLLDAGSYREDWDLAVLALSPPIGEPIDLLPVTTAAFVDDDWRSYGFPAVTGIDGVELGGRVTSLGEAYGKPAIHLDGAKLRDKIAGASGAPVVASSGIVGVLALQRLQAGIDGTTSAFETAYAVPLAERLDWLLERSPTMRTCRCGPFDSVLPVAIPGTGSPRAFLRYYLDEPFGGRDTELAELDRWLRDDRRPFALLAVPSGRGKSMLAVRWADALRRAASALVALVPISIRFGTNSVAFATSLLAARLRELQGIAGLCTSGQLDSMRREIRARSEKPRRTDQRPLVIVIDGLDEADGWTYEDLGLPSKPPAGVKILITMRAPTSDGVARRLRLEPADVLALPELRPLERTATLAITLGAFPGADQLASRVCDLSGGDPLLLQLYLKALREAQGRGEELLDVLRRAEPGWAGYMERWWDDQERQWGGTWPNAKLDVLLAILACAQGPIARREMLDVAGADLTARELQDALVAVRRFVIEIPARGEPHERYTLSHPKLPEFIRHLFEQRAIDVDGYRRKLLDQCLAALAALVDRGVPPSGYALRCTVDHLREAPRDAGAGPLARRATGLTTRAWYDASKLVASFDEGLKVLRGIAAAEDVREVELACVLVAASRESQLADWLPATLAGLLRVGMPATEAATFVADHMANSPERRKQAHAFAMIADQLSDRDLEMLLDRPLFRVSHVPLLVARARRISSDRERAAVLARALWLAREPYAAAATQYDFCWALGLVAGVVAPDRRGRFARTALGWVSHAIDHPAKRLRFMFELVRQFEDPDRRRWLPRIIEDAKRSAMPHLEALFSALALPYLAELDAASVLDGIDQIGDHVLRERRLAEVAPMFVARGLIDPMIERVEVMLTRDLKVKAAAAFTHPGVSPPRMIDEFTGMAYQIGDSLEALLARATLARAADLPMPSELVDAVDRRELSPSGWPTSGRPWMLRANALLLEPAQRVAWIDRAVRILEREVGGRVRSDLDEGLAAVLESSPPEEQSRAVAVALDQKLPLTTQAVLHLLDPAELRDQIERADDPLWLGRAIDAYARATTVDVALVAARTRGWSAIAALSPRLDRSQIQAELARLAAVDVPADPDMRVRVAIHSSDDVPSDPSRAPPRSTRRKQGRVQRRSHPLVFTEPTSIRSRLWLQLVLTASIPQLQASIIDAIEQRGKGADLPAAFGHPASSASSLLFKSGDLGARVVALLDLLVPGPLRTGLTLINGIRIGERYPRWLWSEPIALPERAATWRRALHAHASSRRHQVYEFLADSAPTIAAIGGDDLVARLDRTVVRVQADWP